ncbi:hypothetical protein ABZP36_024670 [Zizania latifolia]
MAAMASPTSPSSPFLPPHLLLRVSSPTLQDLLLHRSPSTDTRQLPSQLQLAVAAAAEEEEAAGVHGEFVAAENALRRGPPRKGRGGQTNAVKPTGGPLRQSSPAAVSLAVAPLSLPRQGTGGQTNALKPTGGPLRQPVAAAAATVILAAALSLPRQGTGGQTFAVLEGKPKGGALRRPAPPGGAGPREGIGGRGGVVHAVADSGPKRPSSPAEGTGGSGGIVNAASY